MTKEELEKEAEEKCAKYKLVEMETYEVEAYIEGAEPREKRIAELEKENAELRTKLEESEKLRDFWKKSSFDWRHKFFEKGSTKRLVKKSKRLTKAKEIIEAMLIYQEGFSHMGELKQEAEQFLKEE